MRKIPMFNGYFATEDGRIFSELSDRFLKSTSNNGWYCHVHIMRNGKPSNQKVHRLIAMAFFGVPESKMDVNHKNGVKTDNRIENLEWVTRSQNAKHCVSVLGRKIVMGLEHPKSKTVVDLETGIFYPCVRMAAIANSINRNTMKNYCRKKNRFSYC